MLETPKTDSTRNLLAEIRGFCKLAGMAPTTFGNKALNNTNFVARLEDGGTCTFATAEKARDYIASHLPSMQES